MQGDRVKASHFSGSELHGVGKDDSCGRDEFLEIWFGCGPAYDYPANHAKEMRESMARNAVDVRLLTRIRVPTQESDAS